MIAAARLDGHIGAPQKGDLAKAAAAQDFEALFIAQMLRAAHAAQLADDPMAADDTGIRDMQDALLAKSIAAQSPLGVARLLDARR